MIDLTPARMPQCKRNDRWWHDAVNDQIYPHGFQDSNGDDIGDPPAICERLPCIPPPSVDAIRISQVFTSPVNDFGNEVSDYCDVDPISAKPDRTAPNNWLSIFGGPAWSVSAKAVQGAPPEITRFGLRRDVGGFDLDVINFDDADGQLRNNPPVAQEHRSQKIGPRIRPHDHRDHLSSKTSRKRRSFSTGSMRPSMNTMTARPWTRFRTRPRALISPAITPAPGGQVHLGPWQPRFALKG
ncbi:MAG: hypothetical protein AAF367_18395 [Pseudomonadota bacterium]